MSYPPTLYWLPFESVSGQVSHTHTWSLLMSGKSCGTVGIVSDAGIELARDGALGSEIALS